MARGYARRQEEKREHELDKWRRFRILAVIQLNAHRGEKQPAQTPEEFLPLPGDPPLAPPMNEETFEETMSRLAEFDTLQPTA